jgi:hypothetical protein
VNKLANKLALVFHKSLDRQTEARDSTVKAEGCSSSSLRTSSTLRPFLFRAEQPCARTADFFFCLQRVAWLSRLWKRAIPYMTLVKSSSSGTCCPSVCVCYVCCVCVFAEVISGSTACPWKEHLQDLEASSDAHIIYVLYPDQVVTLSFL